MSKIEVGDVVRWRSGSRSYGMSMAAWRDVWGPGPFVVTQVNLDGSKPANDPGENIPTFSAEQLIKDEFLSALRRVKIGS